MPKEFSLEFKQLAFSIIDFVEKEKNGPSIPLNNVTDRVQAILGVSERSVYRLKREMKQLREEQEDFVRVTRLSSPSQLPTALSPVSRSGRPKAPITIFEQDTIRLTFHYLLKNKMYPTIENILSRLLTEYPEFPIQSKTSLRREMKALAFQAQRAVYFRKIDELRSSNFILYYHDETWLSKNEEKTAIWFDANGYGRLRKSVGKGPRLAISGLISVNGFHLRSLDIFKCDELHSMDNTHFVAWMDSTASTLRSEHGKSAKIAIIMDNATWHNKLTPESEPPKRAWKKQLIADWLIARKIKFESYMTKPELIQLAFSNLPPKEFIVDKVANKYNIEIVRIPIKHCVLNPVELAWAGLKSYVRQQNVQFNLNDIEQLCNEWLAACGPEHASRYFAHVYKHEETFKIADKNAEQLESDLIDSDDNTGNDTLSDGDHTDD
ncbi:unnamed protein product [Rotaria magnacalcarata]|uniref:Tc1-like transposase DDE domain-containing protein n=1 Tax=Rotaria magnacalcarata TaxID=392030 RepID=A0A816VC99_9BILA|nr:unnamed protein product [Rotaria magnacalcarata]